MVSPFPSPGPILPPFQSILFEGPYPVSSPVHLCLSHIASQPHAKAVLLSPSRQKLALGLQDFNDDWLQANAGTGSISFDSFRIEIFYPPSPTHLAFLLSMLRALRPEDDASFEPKTTFDVVPTLFVLHEPASYFLTDSDHSYTVSSYMMLVNHVLSTISFLSTMAPGNIAFALFDSKLDQLRLPLTRPRFTDPSELEEDDEVNASSKRPEPVRTLVHKYFETIATFENVPSQGDFVTRKRLVLRKSRQDDIIWEWIETQRHPQGASEKQTTTFVWT